MVRRTTPSWHPVGPREGSQSFQDTSEGWRELLKQLSKDCPFSRGKGRVRATQIFHPGLETMLEEFVWCPTLSKAAEM